MVLAPPFLKNLGEWLLRISRKIQRSLEISHKDRSSLNGEPHLPLPLTLELVPAPCWYSNLRSSLSKVHWDQLRKKTYKKARHQCQICGVEPEESLECHEKWDYDDVTKTQILKGLIAICLNCHRVKHMGHANVQGKSYEAFEHLKKINGMSSQEADEYIDKCFTLWNFRNIFQWKIDLSWLDTQDMKLPKVCREPKHRRLEPRRLNFVMSSKTYLQTGLSQPRDFWPSLLAFCKEDSAVAVELIWGLSHICITKPDEAQKLVSSFVEEHLLIDDLFVQLNIMLPNPLSDQVDEDRKCLGLCHAHVLISLLPMTSEKRFHPISKECLKLLQSLCPETYPSSPGQYEVQGDILTRWLTKADVELIWQQNAGLIPNLLFET